LGFDFTMEYKTGSTNIIADVLSRRDGEEGATLLALSALTFQIFDELHQELDVDPAL
jgi:hypothetical protein